MRRLDVEHDVEGGVVERQRFGVALNELEPGPPMVAPGAFDRAAGEIKPNQRARAVALEDGGGAAAATAADLEYVTARQRRRVATRL